LDSSQCSARTHWAQIMEKEYGWVRSFPNLSPQSFALFSAQDGYNSFQVYTPRQVPRLPLQKVDRQVPHTKITSRCAELRRPRQSARRGSAPSVRLLNLVLQLARQVVPELRVTVRSTASEATTRSTSWVTIGCSAQWFTARPPITHQATSARSRTATSRVTSSVPPDVCQS